MFHKLSNTLMGALALVLVTGVASAAASSSNPVRIGVLGDMTGVYSTDFSGPGSAAAAKMAVKDFGGKVLGRPIEVLVANHEDKAGLASTIARKWMDQDHVTLITDLTDSAVALAVQSLAKEKHVITMATGPATTQLTDQQCSKYGIHYGYDTYALAEGTARAVASQKDGKTWYFITVNYAFGHSLQKNSSTVVESLGGKVLGASVYPLGTTDYSSYLLAAKSSGAQVVGLANAGSDLVNSLKGAHQFEIGKSQKLVALLADIATVRAVGLNIAQGLEYTTAWYWGGDKASRAWTKRYLKFSNGAAPTEFHAAVYSAVTAYLNAVKAAGTLNADKVRAELGKMKINDFYANGGHIRADGVLVHTMYLVKVKKPSESHGKWDVATSVRSIPGNKAFMPASVSVCPLLKD